MIKTSFSEEKDVAAKTLPRCNVRFAELKTDKRSGQWELETTP
jgi:hypothetical protein